MSAFGGHSAAASCVEANRMRRSPRRKYPLVAPIGRARRLEDELRAVEGEVRLRVLAAGGQLPQVRQVLFTRERLQPGLGGGEKREERAKDQACNELHGAVG